MSRKKTIGIGILVIVLGIVAGVFLLFMLFVRKTNYVRDDEAQLFTEVLETETEPPVTAEMLYHPEEVTAVGPGQTEGTWSLLVVGEGEKDSSDWRKEVERLQEEVHSREERVQDTEKGTDAPEEASEQTSPVGYGNPKGIILMTVNHPQKRVYFYTFHTDLYALIGEYGGYRLGDAYLAGGGSLLSKTLEQNYGIKIDHYATIRLEDVARALHMEAFSDLDISGSGVDVIEDLVFGMKDIAPSKMAGYVSELLPYVSHNLSDLEIMKMILQIPNIVMYDSVKGRIPYDSLYQKVDDLLVPDIAPTAAHLQASIYGLNTETEGQLSAETDSPGN